MKRNTFLLLLGLCITIKTVNGMGVQNRGYHWDPKLAQQLYFENGCEVCGDLGKHVHCNNISSAAKQVMKNFLATMCTAISTYGYPRLTENFIDRILESEIRSSLHPYTLKSYA